MGSLVQTLAFILPIIATICVLCVLCVNIYLKIRRKIPVNVNCWFCNEWTKVHYDNYNSFICPKCLQYNGFDREGGYNRVLPEQHDELLNQQVPLIQKNNGFKLSNGLCHICNNNQKLKVYQLANFVPLNEDTYDIEVEHFQKQLEKAYKLCGRCEELVKNVVTVQNKWLLGMKMKFLKTKGLSFLDNSKSINSLSEKSRQSFLIYFLNFILILFAFIVFVFAFINITLLPENINKQTLNYFTSYTYPMLNIINNSKIPCIVQEYLDFNSAPFNKYFNTSALVFRNIFLSNTPPFNLFVDVDIATLKSLYFTRPNISLLCLTGLLLQMTTILFTRNGVYKSFKKLLLWSSLVVMTWSQYFDEYPLVIHPLQIITSAYIIYTFLNNNNKRKEGIKMHSKKRHNKMTVNNKLLDEEDLSDHEKDDINFSSDIFNSTLKPKLSPNVIDTAESDCSFETSKSKYTSIQNPFKEPLPRISSPLAVYKTDHVFGKPASFQCPLTTSPVSFAGIHHRNSIHNEPFMCSKTLNNLSSASFKDFNRSVCGSVNGASITSNDTALGDFDINQSLNNLHLGKRKFNMDTSKRVQIKILKSSSCQPILSPPKLHCANYNTWLPEDSVWKRFKDTNYEAANFSSSSSQSSGFASQSNDWPCSKLYSQCCPRHKSFAGTDCYSLPSEASHQVKFKAYRNNNLVDNRNIWQEGFKPIPLLNRKDHFFKPIQNNVISNKRLFSGNYNTNSLGKITSHSSNYT